MAREFARGSSGRCKAAASARDMREGTVPASIRTGDLLRGRAGGVGVQSEPAAKGPRSEVLQVVDTGEDAAMS